jgi:ketosteroid isomerase-like protein
MKLMLLTAVLIFIIPSFVLAQSAKRSNALEQEIRKLEQAQVDALLRDDVAAMKRNWAEDYVVNNPFNEAVDATKGPIQAGTLRYSSFTREIERVLMRGEVVIVMGRETVVPKATSPDSGKTINRRFTNIWMKRKGQWLLTARHANVICQSKE